MPSLQVPRACVNYFYINIIGSDITIKIRRPIYDLNIIDLIFEVPFLSIRPIFRISIKSEKKK